MKKLLLITGDIAAGKTTFSRILSQRSGAAAFQKDTIKEILGDHIEYLDRAENKQLSLAAVELMIHIFSALSASGVPLILEANFSGAELEKLHAAAAGSGYEVLTLVLRADVETLFERYLHRMREEQRDPVHLSAPLHIREEFEHYVEQGRREEVPGEQIAIDASDFSFQKDEELLHKIDCFMKEKRI